MSAAFKGDIHEKRAAEYAEMATQATGSICGDVSSPSPTNSTASHLLPGSSFRD